MNLRKRIRQLHLMLGLAAGLVVFVVGLTGTAFVFMEEIMDFVNRDALTVPVPGTPRRSADELITSYQRQFPKQNIVRYSTYRDPARSVYILGFGPGELQNAYLNPYSGQLIKAERATITFFFYDVMVHTTLLLGQRWGKGVIGVSTVIFTLQLLGGLVLWWPRGRKAAVRNALLVKAGASRKRRIFDLHNIWGFYGLPYALVMALTALFMAYRPVQQVAFMAFGGDATSAEDHYMPKPRPGRPAAAYEPVVRAAFAANPAAQLVAFEVPHDTVSNYHLTVARQAGLFSNDGTVSHLNKYTGQPVTLPARVYRNDELEQLNIMLHMGFWGGIWSKILVFFTGRVITSLPITGFLIWRGKRRGAGRSPRPSVVDRYSTPSQAA